MISHQIIVDYFRSIAENLKDLNGFFRMDLTEIEHSFRSNAQFKCLVLESHEGNFEDSTMQSNVNDRTFAFTIYDHPKNMDYDDQNQKLSECESVGLKVIARMRHDASLPGHFLYGKFNVGTVTYAKVGPVFAERLYGYRFIGSIKGVESLKVDPSDWTDDPLVCS